jgi:uncharacterized protein (UPF0335 family)
VRKEVKDFLEQIRHANARISDEKEHIKDIKQVMHETTGYDKKLINALVKIYCAENGKAEIELYEQVSSLLELDATSA